MTLTRAIDTQNIVTASSETVASDAPSEAVIAIDVGSTIIKIGAITDSGSFIFCQHIPIEYIDTPHSNESLHTAKNASGDSVVSESPQSSLNTTVDHRVPHTIGVSHGLHHPPYGNGKQSRPPYHPLQSQPVTFSLAHTDVKHWFIRIADTIHNSVLKHHITVSALIVSGQAPTLLALDCNDNPVQPVLFRQSLIAWQQPTATHETDKAQSSFLPLASFYKQHFPTRYQQVACWLPLPEYIAFLFGAERCAMVPSPQYEVFYWTAQQIDRYGLQPTHFPSAVAAGKPIGTVRSSIATEWNQACSIPILSGGLDFMFTLIGTNSCDSGVWCDRAGSSYGINVATDHSVATTLFKQYPHPVVPHRYNLSLIVNSDLSYQLTPIIYEVATDFLCYTTYIPSQLPPPLRLSIKQPGMIHIANLAQDAPYRSYLIVEALLFIIEVAASELASLQIPLTEIHLSGGQARSSAWNTLKAIASKTLTTSYRAVDTEMIGMAIVAWHALKHYTTLEQATARLITKQQTYAAAPTSLSGLNRQLTQRFRTFIENLPVKLHSTHEKSTA